MIFHHCHHRDAPSSPAPAASFRRLRAKARALRPILALTVLNIVFTMLLAGPTLAANAIHVVALTSAAANGLYCQLTGCTVAGTFAITNPSPSATVPFQVRTAPSTGTSAHYFTFGSASNEWVGLYDATATNGQRLELSSTPLRITSTTTDITTGTNEDLTLAPNGTGSVALQSGDNQVDIVSSSGTANGHIGNTNTNLVSLTSNAATGGILQASGAGAIVGRQGNAAIGTTVMNVADSMTDASGGTGLWSVDGVGITQWVTNVTASNNLVGTSACAASGDVGKVVLYNDTSTSKFTFCACEQTAAATFAWGAVTAAGDCT